MIKALRSLEDNFTLTKAAAIIGFFTLMSRIIGFLRTAIFASVLGPGDTLDIYYAAFRVPDFIFNLLILGTLSVAFIPVFTELLLTDRKRAFAVANTVFNVSVGTMAATSFILFLFAEPLTKMVVPGFTGEKLQNTILLTRLLLVSPVIFTISNVFSGILHSNKKFLLVSLAPILYNVAIILGFLFLYPRFGFIGWGLGVLAGALLHLSVQMPAAIKQGFRWQPVLAFKDEAVKKIGKLFLPRIFGLDSSNVSLLIATIVGSTLATGTITIFNLGNDLQAVPLGIFALSFAVAAFPVLSESYAKRDNREFVGVLGRTIVKILFFIIPISILILIFRAYIVRLAFGRGEFDWTDTILTFQTLGIFSLSLFAQSLVPYLARAFYARQNTITPVIISLFTMGINAALAVILGRHFGVAGLAGAFSIASVFNMILLFITLRIKLGRDTQDIPGLMKTFDANLASSLGKIVLASTIMGLISYGSLYLYAPLVNTHTTLGIFIQSGLAVATGLAAFFLTAKILKLKEAGSILDFTAKIWYNITNWGFGYKTK